MKKIVDVTGTGEDRKEHSVYILRRPSNLALGLPDTSVCSNRTAVKFPAMFPPNALTGDAIHFSFGESFGDGFEDGFIESRPNSQGLVYWWVDWSTGKIKEVAYWFPANSPLVSLDPEVFTLHEQSLKESLTYSIHGRDSKPYWIHRLNGIYLPTKDRRLLIKGYTDAK